MFFSKTWNFISNYLYCSEIWNQIQKNKQKGIRFKTNSWCLEIDEQIEGI